MSLHTRIDTNTDTTSPTVAADITESEARNGVTAEKAEQLMAQVEAVLCGQNLHLDPNLTLAKLARKSGVPSRLISNAVNQVHHLNISQWVNHFRIEHAKQLLATTELPVTEVYLEAGFQTKSNFHREFSRQVGCTPSEFRKKGNCD